MNPATIGHEAYNPESLCRERHGPCGEWGGALNPTVEIADWFDHDRGLLGGFDGGEKVRHIVAASAASFLCNVRAREFFAVEPCLLCFEAVTGELGSNFGLFHFVEFGSKSLNGLVMRVEVVVVGVAASLKLDVGVALKSAVGLVKFGLDFVFSASGHFVLVVGERLDCLDTRKIRKKIVARKNFLRFFFVCPPNIQFLCHEQRC